MTVEYRNVTVETASGLHTCYMTNAPKLLASEFAKYEYVPQGLDLGHILRPLTESMKPLKDKMVELN